MKTAAVLSSMVALAAASCSHGTTLNPRQEAGLQPTFSYTGVSGPLGWHALNPLNQDCAVGDQQSPIDISSSTQTILDGQTYGLSIDSYREGAEIENLGTTLEVFVNGTITVNNAQHSLRQFHFHTPSEHRIDGEHYAMEVHFVFQAANASLAVLGFMIEIASPYEPSLGLLNRVFRDVDAVSETGAVGHTGPLDFGRLIQHLESSDVFQYSGSLTTPPCAQQVTFNIVRDPILVDVSTYRDVKRIMKFNSRYTQNHHGEENLLSYARDVLDA